VYQIKYRRMVESTSYIVRFRLDKALTQMGQDVYIIGNCKMLSSWHPEQAIKMTTDKGRYPVWESQTLPVSLHDLPELLEYKYIIKRQSEVIWEDGPNRRIPAMQIRAALERDNDVLIIDRAFNDVGHPASFIKYQTIAARIKVTEIPVEKHTIETRQTAEATRDQVSEEDPI